VLQSLHNLSDEQTEFLIRDRLSFMRFLNLGLEDPVPDATTIWLFREALAEAGLIDKLFGRFGQHLEAKGYIARGGQIVGASIVSAPKQRNSRDENDEVKAGKTPQNWEKTPRQECPERQGCAVDQEARQELLRLRTISASTSRTRSSVSGTRPTPASTTARSSSSSLMRNTPLLAGCHLSGITIGKETEMAKKKGNAGSKKASAATKAKRSECEGPEKPGGPRRGCHI
jgi:IS5 family transposase